MLMFFKTKYLFRNMDAGDLSEQKALRERLQGFTFLYDLLTYILDLDLVWGIQLIPIQGSKFKLCKGDGWGSFYPAFRTVFFSV